MDLLTLPQIQLLDNNANPLVGGKIHTYEPSSLTNKATYTSSDGLVAQTNPIILDANGRFASPVFGSGTYRIIIKDASDNTIADIDDVPTVSVTSAINDQWATQTSTPTYLSATSYTRTGDTTLIDHPGRRFRAAVAGGTIVYGEIISAVFVTVTTVTVRLDESAALDSGLSVVDLALLTVTGRSIPSAALRRTSIIITGGTTALVAEESGLTINVLTASTINLPVASTVKEAWDCLIHNADPTTAVTVGLQNQVSDTLDNVVNNTNTLEPGDSFHYFANRDRSGYFTIKNRLSVDKLFRFGSVPTIASASTVDMTDNSMAVISGSTQINQFRSLGNLIWMRFSAAPNINHDGDNLILPTGADIQAAASDALLAYQYEQDKFRVINYQRGDGSPLVIGPGLTSNERTISNGGGDTLPHGFGARPSLVYAFIRCISDEGGYVANDELLLQPWNFDTSSSSHEAGCAIWVDAVNINVRHRNIAAWDIPHADTGAAFAITFANWRLVVRAWR